MEKKNRFDGKTCPKVGHFPLDYLKGCIVIEFSSYPSARSSWISPNCWFWDSFDGRMTILENGSLGGVQGPVSTQWRDRLEAPIMWWFDKNYAVLTINLKAHPVWMWLTWSNMVTAHILRWIHKNCLPSIESRWNKIKVNQQLRPNPDVGIHTKKMAHFKHSEPGSGTPCGIYADWGSNINLSE